MQLCWENLDERVVRRVHAHIAHSANEAVSSAAAQTVRQSGGQQALSETGEDKPLDLVWSVFAAAIAFFVVALYGTICFHLTGPLATLAILGLPVGVAVMSWLPATFAARNETAPIVLPLRGRIAPPTDTLRRAFSQSAQTRAESLYGEVVLLLTQADVPCTKSRFLQKTNAPDETTRLLRECNQLLADSFRLETESRRISRLRDAQTVSDLEAERFALLQKMDNEPDVLARASLRESVSLCDERIEKIRAYPTLLARLDAHQEMVCQSLALAAATLAQEQAAPHALHPPDVGGLRAALQNLSQQTRAVENAVLEITGDLPH